MHLIFQMEGQLERDRIQGFNSYESVSPICLSLYNSLTSYPDYP